MQIFASPVASERAKTSVVKRSSSLVFNLEQTSKIVKKKRRTINHFTTTKSTKYRKQTVFTIIIKIRAHYIIWIKIKKNN